jgi:hypothetical protein
LAESIAAAGVPRFTVSVGLADSTYASNAAEVIAAADNALLIAKQEGRDQLIIASPSTPDNEDSAEMTGGSLQRVVWSVRHRPLLRSKDCC